MKCPNTWCETPFVIKRMARPPTQEDGFHVNQWHVVDDNGSITDIYMWTANPEKHWVRYKKGDE